MGSKVQDRSHDTYVRKSRPTRPNLHSTSLMVGGEDGPDHSYGYVYFPRVAPYKATLISAHLRLPSLTVPENETRTLYLRPTRERTTLSRLTWENRPKTTAAGQKQQTKSGALPGGGNTVWEFDVTDHMQAVSDGAEWWGWRLSSDATVPMRLYAGDTQFEDLRPTLETVWSDAPDQPTQLIPSGGRVISDPKPHLRWDYTDVSGDVTMAGLHVKVAATQSMTSPWDSGEQPATQPEMDLETLDFPGSTSPPPPFPAIPPGATRWWQVRVQDGAGIWSDWSDPVEMKYLPKDATLTMLSPAPGGTQADPTPLDDATPVVSWIFGGGGAVQTAYRVRVWKGSARGSKKAYWDSGKQPGALTAITVPQKVFRWEDSRYTVVLDVFDQHNRQTTPGAVGSYRVETIVRLESGSLLEVDWIEATPQDPWPFVEIRWNRAPAPDGWVIGRSIGKGGLRIATVDYADTLQPDGTHKFIDRHAPPNIRTKYFVRPVVNGKVGAGNPVKFVTSRPIGIWLVNEEDEVCLWDVDEGTWELAGNVVVYEPINGAPPMRVVQGRGGWRGDLSGLIFGNVPNIDRKADEWRDAFLRIARDGGAVLTASTAHFPVITADEVPAPTAYVDRYKASFAFWQSDSFDWEDL